MCLPLPLALLTGPTHPLPHSQCLYLPKPPSLSSSCLPVSCFYFSNEHTSTTSQALFWGRLTHQIHFPADQPACSQTLTCAAPLLSVDMGGFSCSSSSVILSLLHLPACLHTDKEGYWRGPVQIGVFKNCTVQTRTNPNCHRSAFVGRPDQSQH